MSNRIEAEAGNAYQSPFGQELAPSELRRDEPTFPRFVGMAGLLLVFAGGFVILFNAWLGPRWLAAPTGYLFLIPGFAGLLFHAAREHEIQLRRSYGVFGLALVGLAIVLAVLPGKDSVAGAMFLPWGVLSALLGLFFLLPFAHNESEAFWRRIAILTLAGVGGVAALVGMAGGTISSNFLVNPGLLLILVGLVYLWGAIGLVGADSGFGYRLALALGGLGLLAALIALARSVAPEALSSGSRYFLPAGLLLIVSGVTYLLFALALISENHLVVLTRRELASYFYSPIAYIVLLGFTFVGALTYFQFSDRLAMLAARGQAFPEPIVRIFFIDIYPVMCVIFVVPVITMKLLSEERRTGTLEVLLTAPVSELTVVLSKFLAALIYFLFLWAPWGFFLLALRVEGGRDYDYRPLLSFGVILVANSAALIAMGVFFSALTRNQIIAAVLTFGGMMVWLSFYFIKEGLGPNWQSVLMQLGFVDLWIESLAGKLYLRSLIVQISVAVFWLFLATKALEARKWT